MGNMTQSNNPKFCDQCGTTLRETSKFCPECGVNISEKPTDKPEVASTFGTNNWRNRMANIADQMEASGNDMMKQGISDLIDGTSFRKFVNGFGGFALFCIISWFLYRACS
tara:strand:- start:115 stop:447 length:333 start_codon:yes stop_codon:yes gene_type:complete